MPSWEVSPKYQGNRIPRSIVRGIKLATMDRNGVKNYRSLVPKYRSVEGAAGEC